MMLNLGARDRSRAGLSVFQRATLWAVSFCLICMSGSSVAAYSIQSSHPRIYFNSKQLTALRNAYAAGSDADYKAMLGYLDRAIANPPSDVNALPVQIGSFIAVISQGSNYIGVAKSWLIKMASVSADSDDDTKQRNRLLSLSIGYDWLFNFLTTQERLTVRTAIYNHLTNTIIEGYWQEPGYVSGHSRYGNVAALAGCLALYGEDNRVGSILATVASNWINGYNAALGDIGKGGGHHMGWKYGAAYTSPEAYLMWYSATGELWNSDFVRDMGYFYIYGIGPKITVPVFGDCWNDTLSDANIVNIVSVSAGLGKNPYAEQFFKKYVNSVWEGYYLIRIITKDKSLQPAALENLPLYRYFSGSGFCVVRSSWDDDAAKFIFKSSPFYSRNHHHLDQNSLTVDYKGPLLIDSGCYDGYGSDHWRSYYTRTVAHNSLLVLDPEESFSSGYVNDGGQRVMSSEPSNLADLQGKYKLGGITAFSTWGGTQAPDCVFMKGDGAKAYDSSKLNRFLRSVILLSPNLSGWNYPIAAVFDEVTLGKELIPRILWHVNSSPSLIDGSYALIGNGKGFGRVELLAPRDGKLQLIGGSGHQWDVNGQDYPPAGTCDNPDTGWGRIEFSTPAAVRETHFVSLISLGEEPVTKDKLPLGEYFEGSDWIGVRASNALAIISVADAPQTKVTVVQDPGENLIACIVANLSPNALCQLSLRGHTYEAQSNDEGLAVFLVLKPANLKLVD